MPSTAADILETLLDLGDPAVAAGWQPLEEPAPGARSHGRLVAAGDGWAAFVGEILLESGGLAAVRSAVGSFDLSDREGVELEVRGDGRAYLLAIRTDPWFDDVAYHARFETRAGGRSLHRLPFAGFRAAWRGRPVPGAPLLAPSRVCAFAFLAEERPGGAFRLEIASIRAYGGG